MHEAVYFRTISQKSKLVVDLVQFCKPNGNEEPVAPVLRTMEEIRKLKAEVILPYTNKESVELMLQQVRKCAVLVQREIILFVLKGLNVTHLRCERAKCFAREVQSKQHKSRIKYSFCGLQIVMPLISFSIFFVFE